MSPALLLLYACAEEPVDTAGGGSLPEETGELEVRYDTSTYRIETGALEDTGDQTPEVVLQMVQEGDWTLGPAGGPWTELSGLLAVTETYEETGRENCASVYALTGTAVDDRCDTCTDAFEVSFAPSEGNPAPCRDSDLPELYEERVLGWAPDEQTIYWNYYDSGAWVPWYDATLEGDTLHVRWAAEVGLEEGG